MKEFIVGVFGSFLLIFAKYLGGWDVHIEALIILMVLDWVSGLILAGFFNRSNKSANGGLESRAGVKGIFRKLCMLFGVALAVQCDIIVGSHVIRDATILALIANEGLSIIENLGAMGVPLPAPVRNAISLLNKKGESGDKHGSN